MAEVGSAVLRLSHRCLALMSRYVFSMIVAPHHIITTVEQKEQTLRLRNDPHFGPVQRAAKQYQEVSRRDREEPGQKMQL